MKPETIKIDEIEYVRKDSINLPAEKLGGKKYVIVRTRSAGVFAGYIQEEPKNSDKAVLLHARRLWYWEGASSLSQLAMEGVKSPETCKFPCEVERVALFEIIEILDVTKQAQDSIKGVKIWEQ